MKLVKFKFININLINFQKWINVFINWNKGVFFFNLYCNIFFKNNLFFIKSNLWCFDFISRLYYLLLEYFDLDVLFYISSDFIVIWEILVEWYHFDFSLIFDLYEDFDYLGYYLFVFKYNLEFLCWHVLYASKSLLLNNDCFSYINNYKNSFKLYYLFIYNYIIIIFNYLYSCICIIIFIYCYL